MRAWIAEGAVPSAIFAANDPSAIGAIGAIEEAGMRVPEDVAVVGAGDIHYGDRLSVPLTTVTWDKTRMGQQAAHLLLNMLGREADAALNGKKERVICEPELVARKSCGVKQTLCTR